MLLNSWKCPCFTVILTEQVLKAAALITYMQLITGISLAGLQPPYTVSLTNPTASNYIISSNKVNPPTFADSHTLSNCIISAKPQKLVNSPYWCTAFIKNNCIIAQFLYFLCLNLCVLTNGQESITLWYPTTLYANDCGRGNISMVTVDPRWPREVSWICIDCVPQYLINFHSLSLNCETLQLFPIFPW